MALDGCFLRHIKKELEEELLGGRVDKIHQPNREELVVAFRTREAAFKVLFSARANSARGALYLHPSGKPQAAAYAVHAAAQETPGGQAHRHPPAGGGAAAALRLRHPKRAGGPRDPHPDHGDQQSSAAYHSKRREREDHRRLKAGGRRDELPAAGAAGAFLPAAPAPGQALPPDHPLPAGAGGL